MFGATAAPQNNGFLEGSIDKHSLKTLEPREEAPLYDSWWLFSTSLPSSPSALPIPSLSPTSTTMDCSKPLPLTPSEQFFHRQEVILPASTYSACNTDDSKMPRRPSELSCPSLMGDSFSSASDNECFDHPPLDLPQNGWDAYWFPSNTKQHSLSHSHRVPSMHLDLALPTHLLQPPNPSTQEPLSPRHRNFAHPNLPALQKHFHPSPSPAGDLHNATPTRQPRPRAHTAQTHLPPSTTKSKRPSRPRANTTPSKYHPPPPPSTSSNPPPTPNDADGEYLYMSPPTPCFAIPLASLPPLALMDETSYFSDDDEGSEPRSAKLAKVFKTSLRRDSAGSGDGTPCSVPQDKDKDKEKERPKGRRLRKSFGELFKIKQK